MNSTVSKLFSNNAGFSLPYLIHLYGTKNGKKSLEMRFINDVKDCKYNGFVYEAEAFDYTPNASEYGMTGGGTLEISVIGNQIIDLVENYTDITFEAVGVLLDDGTIEELRFFKHHNGSVSVDRASATFTFKRDERLDMSFPALIWNTQNNRGNA